VLLGAVGARAYGTGTVLQEAMMKNAQLRFRARLYAAMEGKNWTFLDLPENSSQALGSRARVAVAGTMNGHPFKSSVMPTGRGNHSLMVNRQMREGARASAGDEVDVAIARDTAPRTVKVPADLAKALRASAEAQANWKAFSTSHRKEYVAWIEDAKKSETRAARIRKAVAMIAAGKKQR